MLTYLLEGDEVFLNWICVERYKRLFLDKYYSKTQLSFSIIYFSHSSLLVSLLTAWGLYLFCLGPAEVAVWGLAWRAALDWPLWGQLRTAARLLTSSGASHLRQDNTVSSLFCIVQFRKCQHVMDKHILWKCIHSVNQVLRLCCIVFLSWRHYANKSK